MQVKEHKVKNKLNPYLGFGYGIIDDYNVNSLQYSPPGTLVYEVPPHNLKLHTHIPPHIGHSKYWSLKYRKIYHTQNVEVA
jgi:hypothetical protein